MRLRCKGLATPKTIIKELVLNGLDAIEAYHASHSTENTGDLLQIAAELNLLVTGGSDYHGRNKPEIRLGTGKGKNLFLPYRLLECIKERVGRAQEKWPPKLTGRCVTDSEFSTGAGMVSAFSHATLEFVSFNFAPAASRLCSLQE